MNDLRIIFMGTPEFAVPSLELLIKNNFNVVAVITAPDKPSGRGLKLQASPVKQLAEKHHIPVLQPDNLKSEDFIQTLKTCNANLQVVVAFRMLPEIVWAMPKLGTFNLHASLLPQYRGAAPINWAIINGEKETGVTTFFLEKEIDTGEIIFQQKTPIDPDENVESLYQRLMALGADLVLKTTCAIQTGQVHTSKQAPVPTKPAPKIFKETCEIDFSKKAVEVKNFVRGLSTFPGAWTKIEGKSCKIFRVDIETDLKGGKEGTENRYVTNNKSFLNFFTSDGEVSVKEFQLEGKKKMSIEEFFRGNKI